MDHTGADFYVVIERDEDGFFVGEAPQLRACYSQGRTIDELMANMRDVGPGFLEAVYQAALEHELTLRGIPFEAQKRLAVTYKGRVVGDYIADLVVGGQIILELKAISALTKAHEAQAHNYPSMNSGQAWPLPACALPSYSTSAPTRSSKSAW